MKIFQTNKKSFDQLNYHVTNSINLAEFLHPLVTKVLTSRKGGNPVYATSYYEFSKGTSSLAVAVQCTRVARQQRASGSCAGNVIEVEQVRRTYLWHLFIHFYVRNI